MSLLPSLPSFVIKDMCQLLIAARQLKINFPAMAPEYVKLIV
jgi:hypothetical protein